MNKWMFLLVVCLPVLGFSQNTRNTSTKVPTTYTGSLDKKEKKGFLGLGKKDKAPNRTSYEDEVMAFRKKVKEAYKQNAKEEKLAEKPQYSDPSYFGHKRVPKRRPPGKQKFCKKCGIKH